MSWARMDDRYDDHPKIKRAWRRHPRAVGLHAMAITYSARHETDGLVDLDWLEEKVPNAREREAVIRTLVECGLLDPVDGESFRVHDYTDFNPSREQLSAKRERDANRKMSARTSSGHGADTSARPNGHGAESNGNPNGPSHARPQASPPGVARRPSLPVPTQLRRD